MVERREQLAALRADWHERLRWADEQWTVLLRQLWRRDPSRSALASRASISADRESGYSMRGARRAWRYLTEDERRTWLQVCQVVFQSRPLPGGVAGPRAG